MLLEEAEARMRRAVEAGEPDTEGWKLAHAADVLLAEAKLETETWS